MSDPEGADAMTSVRAQVIHEYSRGIVIRVAGLAEAASLEAQAFLRVRPPTWMRPGWYQVVEVRPAMHSDGIPGDYDVTFIYLGRRSARLWLRFLARHMVQLLKTKEW